MVRCGNIEYAVAGGATLWNEMKPLVIGHQILGAFLIAITAGSCARLSQTPAADGGSEKSIGYLAAKVVRISEEYANINTDVSGEELFDWGIADKQQFAVKYKNHTIEALLGQDYGDVARGEWVALIETDGNLQLAISFGHAATEIGCAVGDTLYIEAPVAQE